MKQLEKKHFLKFLHTISTTLDESNIKHDIPYCHIDKNKWNYINIIISDNITDNELFNNFDIIFLKKIDNIIYTKIDDFDIRFIKTADKLWLYTFYYYSWDILHILMNTLVKVFNLSYDNTGLYYIYENEKIKLTNNLQDIFDFFELPFQMIINGFPTYHTIFSFIETSPYFETNLFSLKNFKKYDNYYENNINYYINFIKHKPNKETIKIKIENQISQINAYFKKANLFEKLLKIQLNNK